MVINLTEENNVASFSAPDPVDSSTPSTTLDTPNLTCKLPTLIPGVWVSKDMMSYPYPHCTGHPDLAGHVQQFLITCNTNHATHLLGAVEEELCKIVDFGLSLEGQAANSYSDQEHHTFTDLHGTVQSIQKLVSLRSHETNVFKQ